MNYYTADPHYFHEMIIQHCRRPFKTLDEMHKVLIRNWNRVVEKNDDVYIVGDFSLLSARHKSKYQQILDRLVGRKHLIIGNHDQNKTFFYSGDYGVGFYSVHYPYLKVENYILCHDPSIATTDRNRWFICGHVHDLFKVQKNVINVGVDVWDFTPVSEDTIYQITKEYEL